MKLVILHASDIHFSSERYESNLVRERVPQILAAVRSLFVGNDVSACLLMATGDIAFAGLSAEYDTAASFLRELERGLAGLYPSAIPKTILIPGNHDCDFGQAGQAREKLIENPDPRSLADGTIVRVATMVQDNFFRFSAQFNPPTVPIEGMDRLYAAHRIDIDGKSMVVRTLNSAWASTNPENRTLTLPVDYLKQRFAELATPSIAITTLHHPYNWFEPNNAKALRTLLERSSDIILTGHEHSSSTYTRTGRTGEQNEYIEGGVLQDNEDPNSSAFNVIAIDIGRETQSVHSFVWTGELYERVNDVVDLPFVRNRYRLRGEFQPSSEFEDVLNDPDATYAHPFKDRIRLDDVFVYPDVVQLDEMHMKSVSRVVVPGRGLVSHVLNKEHLILTAPERAGKTALARTLFKDLRKNGKIPLMMDGRTIRPAALRNLQKVFDGAFDEQYSAELRSRYWQLPKESRAVVVDDYHQLPLTKDFRNSLIQSLLERFQVVVLLANNDLRIQELTGHDRESRLLWKFDHCEVLGFGHRLRAEFIARWYRIGREGHVEDSTLVNKAIQLEKTISNILGHDLLPPYPIYLLLLLQQLEANNPLDTAAASYGRLYGAVVTAHLVKFGERDEVETKINYLSELAFHLYSSKRDHVSDEDARAWHAEYCGRHLVELPFDGLRADLVRSHILQDRNGELRFRYRAGFYYFVALYVADNLTMAPIRDEVKRLCGELHREDAANIVLFLCHLSKESLILDEILAQANRLFASSSEADLMRDAEFCWKLVETLDSPVLEDGDPERHRLRALEDRDRALAPADDEAYAHRVREETDEKAETEAEALIRRQTAELNSAFKTIQIAGQILRNFGGRLSGPDKLKITDACYALGLRVLGHTYSLFEHGASGLVKAAEKTLLEKNPNLDPRDAEKRANGLVFGLVKLVTVGCIKHVSNSVGLEKLSPAFAQVLEQNPTISRRMIDLSIRLDHFAAIPVDQTLQLQRDVDKSLVALEALRYFVFNRFYFFTAPYDVKQRLCSKLGIKLQPILLDRDPKRDT